MSQIIYINKYHEDTLFIFTFVKSEIKIDVRHEEMCRHVVTLSMGHVIICLVLFCILCCLLYFINVLFNVIYILVKTPIIINKKIENVFHVLLPNTINSNMRSKLSRFFTSILIPVGIITAMTVGKILDNIYQDYNHEVIETIIEDNE